MWNRRLVRALLLLTAIVAPGCQAFYAYRPVAIQVQDAETKQPIPGAAVRISYPLVQPSQTPYEVEGATGADGIAHLRAAPYGPAGVLVEVSGKNYLLDQKTVPVTTIEAIKPAGWFEKVEKRPATVTLELYAAPRPVVELVLPAGFRGPIKAEVQVRADAPSTAGQRLFRYGVTTAGIVQVSGPALVERVLPLDYQAITADGTRLTREAKGLAMGFYAVKSEGRRLTFFVGTRAEYDALRRAELQDGGSGGRPSLGRGSGGGGGRHGGRHGQQATDPPAN